MHHFCRIDSHSNNELSTKAKVYFADNYLEVACLPGSQPNTQNPIIITPIARSRLCDNL